MTTSIIPQRGALHVIFFLAAAIFITALPLAPWPGGFLLKVIPIGCLLWLVASVAGGWRRRGILLALLCSAAGDVALELGAFTVGLGAFLLGHLAYLVVFSRQLRVTSRNALPVCMVLAGSGSMMVWLAPHLGSMMLPVYLYTTVISVMALAAILGRDNTAVVALGAILFVISDSLIAMDRFVEAIPGARYYIMITYYAAQYLLTADARAGLYATSCGRSA